MVLQLARLLMPTSVSQNPSAAEKLRAYKNPEQCLTDFCDWFESKDVNPVNKQKYDFTVQIAPHALLEYKCGGAPEWNKHRIWAETKKGGALFAAIKRRKRSYGSHRPSSSR